MIIYPNQIVKYTVQIECASDNVKQPMSPINIQHTHQGVQLMETLLNCEDGVKLSIYFPYAKSISLKFNIVLAV